MIYYIHSILNKFKLSNFVGSSAIKGFRREDYAAQLINKKYFGIMLA